MAKKQVKTNEASVEVSLLRRRAMGYNPQAEELNNTICSVNPVVFDLLSEKGKAAYFPKKGILGQAAEASNCRINATIGIALDDDGSTTCLKLLDDKIHLSSDRAFKYAPSFGVPALRKIWQQMIRKKNPSLGEAEISLPVVSCALTHGIFVAGQMFADASDTLISPNYFWGNYNLAITAATGSKVKHYPTFEGEGYNVNGLGKVISATGIGKKLIILNFPNNPTGYTPTIDEAYAIRDLFVSEAEKGSKLAVIIDDAYFGLVFREGIYEESLFSLLATAHENILAIKIDGATKEDYVWGFRTGFVTFGIKGGTPELYSALEAKTAAEIRATISNAPNPSQQLLLEAYSDPQYEIQKQEKHDLLRRRFDMVDKVLADHPEYSECFKPLPYNSGYFMCIEPDVEINAEELRVLLVNKYSVGLISTEGLIRVAFSSTPTHLLPDVFEAIYQACLELKK